LPFFNTIGNVNTIFAEQAMNMRRRINSNFPMNSTIKYSNLYKNYQKSVFKACFGKFALLAIGAALAACGGGGSAGTAPASPAPGVPVSPPQSVAKGGWVVMGSSTASGKGAPEGKGWVNVVGTVYANRLTEIANLATPGSVTYQGLSSASTPPAGRPAPDPARNIDQALSRKPVVLFLAYPSNDVLSGYSNDEVVNNLLAIRSAARANQVAVLVLSIQPRQVNDAQRAQLLNIHARLATAVGPCYVDIYSKLSTAGGLLLPQYDSGDGIHPNETGHQVIAATVQQVVDSGKCVVLP